MSIPTPFNPLGTSVGANEVPFVQPVMTSATKWSNEPSFGCSVLEDDRTSSYYYSTYQAWASMGVAPSQYASAERNKMWIRRYAGDYQYASWLFQKELRFEKIEFVCCFTKSSYDILGIDSNDETIHLGQISATVGERVTITVRERKLFKTIRIGIKGLTSQGDPGLTELKFTAFYRP